VGSVAESATVCCMLQGFPGARKCSLSSGMSVKFEFEPTWTSIRIVANPVSLNKQHVEGPKSVLKLCGLPMNNFTSR
jgi:hypothetical protein